ncbi:MAG: cyclase family protein [Candidatus Bathyarchaeia archaeon]
MSYREILSSIRKLKAFDLSPMFDTNMLGWPTHPNMGIIRDARNFDQDGYLAQTLVMSEHTGSHVDAPAHVMRAMPQATIDTYPPDLLIGLYKKYDFTAYEPKAGEMVTLQTVKAVQEKQKFELERDDIVLLDFGWDKYYHPESKDPQQRAWWGRNMPGLSEDACIYFADAKVRAVGSNTAGCDDCEVDGVLKYNYGHMKYFLPNHILIIEGLIGLGQAPPTGIFIALPLKIKGGSGSPIRPILLA